VSLLSRLSMRGGKRKDSSGNNDDSSEPSEQGTLGTQMNFSPSIGSGGFIPHHKEPPRCIKVKTHDKKMPEFNHLFLAQEIAGIPHPAAEDAKVSSTRNLPETGGAIWAMEFSKDGKYLAAAGKDHMVRVWAVLATPEERKAQVGDGDVPGHDNRLVAPVFRTHPQREFEGHTGEVLDLSWSKNNFLLSSSMDKTVRLWHMSRKECLSIFKHKDFVTSISFHPRDDRFFLAGSLDSTLRLWSIPDKLVAYSVQLPDLITAVAFSPDGKTAIAGVLSGLCLFYDTEGLKLQTQVHVRSSRGKNAKGSKITGIHTISMPLGDDGAVKVLVTSNDSRIRVYDMREKTLDVKLKGNENTCSQIHAHFSDDSKRIICGSEDGRAYIWPINSAEGEAKDKQPYEFFDAHSDIVTATLFAPTKAREVLSGSGDPIYDLCNPPPVTLLSLQESASLAHPDDEVDLAAQNPKPEESPAYIARKTHYGGNILVTADRTGLIKVFRQDCAVNKRRNENWETASAFSRKLASGRASSLIGRSASIMTRTSASSHPHSRRGSISQSVTSNTPQQSSDRIISWRQGIENGRTSSLSTPTRSERSLSPSKSSRTPINTSLANLALEARKRQYSIPSPQSKGPESPSSGVFAPRPATRPSLEKSSTGLPIPSFTLHAADEANGKSDPASPNGSFWNLSRWRGISALRGSTTSPVPGSQGSRPQPTTDATAQTLANAKNEPSRRKSHVPGSITNSNEVDKIGRRKSLGPGIVGTMPVNEEDEASDQNNSNRGRLSQRSQSEHPSDGEVSKCKDCGGEEFKAKRVTGKYRFLCAQCGAFVDEGKV
jgi:WD repeat-containing protein 44